MVFARFDPRLLLTWSHFASNFTVIKEQIRHIRKPFKNSSERKISLILNKLLLVEARYKILLSKKYF